LEKPEIKSYRDLRVWQEAMSLAESCYRITQKFPRDELFGLTSQIRRASTSIPANIAEGHGRESTGSFIQHLRIAQGSLKELETHLLLAERIGLIHLSGPDTPLAGCESVGRMLRPLIRTLQKKSGTRSA
jgi:four helix bundle protein